MYRGVVLVSYAGLLLAGAFGLLLAPRIAPYPGWLGAITRPREMPRLSSSRTAGPRFRAAVIN